MRARWLAATLLGCLMPLAAMAAWKDKTPGPNKARPAAQKRDAASVRTSIVFSTHDRQIITGWVRDRRSSLPPGLAKKEQLPPGLQKQLMRNGTLPPGLEKRAQPLPVELERMLPPLPAEYRRVAINGSLIIMNRKTRLIADVFANFAP